MNNENEERPQYRKDGKPARARIKKADGENRSYNHDGESRQYNHDGGHRQYNSYSTDGNGEHRQYNRDGQHRSYNSDRKPYNRDGQKRYNANGEGRSYNSDRKPYNRDGQKRYNANGEGRSYGNGEGRNYNGEGRSYNSDRKPYNRDGQKRYNANGEGRSYNGDRKPYNGQKRSYGDGENRPRRNYDNGEGRSYNAEGRSSYGNRQEGNRQQKGQHYRSAGEAKHAPQQFKVYKRHDEPQYHANQKNTDPNIVRLNKFIANSGICSRREADEYITAGLVTVNGVVVSELGTKVNISDDIRFNGERLKGEKKVYIVMNKPKGFVTTTSDPHAEKTVMDLINPDLCPQRIFPVGRLDKDTTGVLMFTNDGDMAEKLSHPSNRKKKIYQVKTDRPVNREDFEHLLMGVDLEDGPAAADMLSYLEGDMCQLGLEIHNGRNRIVRRMFEALGYRVKSLDRVYFAGLTKKNLRRGAWRFLEESEVNMLIMGSFE